jgi:REP element-mobilizing transposase RayT
MANTYTQLNVHAVFSVKGRENTLSSKMRPDLFAFISGILSRLNCFPLAVNGFKDHIHMFFELHPTKSVSDILEKVKSGSSKWINEKKFMPGTFSWQSGYSAFTYSRSQRNDVIGYIMNQEEHHKKATFREEYLRLLEKFEMDYDPKYIFEFYE